ncbi:Holliday junction resolvase RecU [Paenibacillus larvae subsp. larvae]|uniref:Holliday junction resolvase RecU n=1 Tax=Paenibacillus larvae subsp. larvae TaxID=147375 RepID=A0A2L1TWL8_9BACL|nr:Holliday junction resolvase RecU [Paenibacillus larvae]AQT85671.1 hypothetical protein B1222_16690 [Paenibacillus larvae subsp. pulvifaciens]AVF25073.1 Holliday junction resolvase RecU [Paenibacillus larvae subsp. larvae]AVF29837.1 Holliday junction resolvase RecU [Paenibacillus larvae subsp. larvae]MBH0341222.1 recombinase RecU [Paenibacillus larvae]MCY7522365.1 Holliday junction resolvase RecU [Paenibacillus larvae]
MGTTANRGMAFEHEINVTNRMYEKMGLAVINKRPTPVKIMGRTAGRITGFLESPSTVDYDGTYRGKSIVFEAKSTKEINRFDLKNIHDHQVDYLRKCHEHGAVSFLLIKFEKHNTVYLLPYQSLKHFWERRKTGERGTQSIQIVDFDIHAYQVYTSMVPVDYLTVVDRAWNIG